MKNKLSIVITMIMMLSGVGGMSPASAIDLNDPAVKAMHQTVNDVRVKAEKGDPQAQTWMGMISVYGFGGNQDFVAAKSWFEKAAGQGYPEAMVQLGNLYENGLGVEEDLGKAVAWYRQSVALSYPHGQFRLGLLQLDGVGVAEDEVAGEKLLRSACDKGYQTSCGVLMWRENKITEAAAIFNLQCQAGDQLACGFQSQLPSVLPGGEGAQIKGADKEQGGVGIYLVIGLALVGLLIFWLIRSDPGEDEKKGE